MTLFDIHTHIFPEYDSIKGYSVKSILNTYPAGFYNLQKNNITHSTLSCGIHPWDAQDSENVLPQLSEIVKDKSVVAIGEAGIDKLCDVDLRIQTKAFRSQIELAIATDKPMIIHCVKAWDELIALYNQYQPHKDWIIHGFRGNAQLAQQLCRLGLKLSIGEKFNIETLKAIDLESIYCETDESDKSIYDIYYNIAHVLDMSFDKLSNKIASNVYNLFGNL